MAKSSSIDAVNQYFSTTAPAVRTRAACGSTPRLTSTRSGHWRR